MELNYREFLKPDKRVFVIFIVLAILSFLDLFAFGALAIPCNIKPLVAPDIEVFWSDSMCSLRPGLIGVSIQFTALSYLTLVFYTIILPYSLACLISKYIWKKKSWFLRIK